MKHKFSLALVMSLFVSVAFNLPHAISQGQLHDDFKKTTIDPLKWDNWEVVREIQQFQVVKNGPLDGKLVSKVTAYGSKINNYLNFKSPNTIRYIEADVMVNSIADKYKTEENHVIPRARLAGRFYNDGSSAAGSGNLTGDVQGAIGVRKYKGKIEVHWGVVKFTDAAGENYETLGEGTLLVPAALKKTYKLSIQFDEDSMTFTFGVTAPKGKSFVTLTAPFTTGDTFHAPGGPWKAIGTQVWFAPLASSLSGSISATFDNVIAGTTPGDVLVTEDFSISPLAATKWNSQEFVRETPKGKLRSELRRVNAGDSNGVVFKNPQKVKDFRANVTVNTFENLAGCSARARLGGYFYNTDGPPDPARGYQGEVWAEISIGGTGTSPKAFWSVSRSTTVEEGGGWETTSVAFPDVSITPGQTYNLFIGWDGTQFTFKVTEGETIYTDDYITPATVFPPSHNNKGLSTRISPPSPAPASFEASISATFDDVVINQTGLPVDGSWLIDIVGVGEKGGAVFHCFQNKFEGYGFSGGPFKIKGNYTVDSSGVANGDYIVYDWDGVTVDNFGRLTGTVDTKITKFSLAALGNGESIPGKLTGTALPADPVVPTDWTVKVSPGGDILDTFTIDPLIQDKSYPRVFTIYGSIYDPIDRITTVVDGGFFLGAKNKVYGGYTVDGFDNGQPYTEDGLLSGTMIFLPSTKFTMTAVSEPIGGKRHRSTLMGVPK